MLYTKSTLQFANKLSDGQKAAMGTVKINYNLAKDYNEDVESKIGLKLQKTQIEKLKDTLRKNK